MSKYINLLSNRAVAEARSNNPSMSRGLSHIVENGCERSLCGKNADEWWGNIGSAPEDASCHVCSRAYARIVNQEPIND